MRRRPILIASHILLALSCAMAAVQADTIDTTGQEPYEPCGYCHEYDGNASMPGFPVLAGQHRAYLVKQLKDFRAGRRSGTMQGTAELLSDADIETVADYFSAQARRPKSLDPMPVAERDRALALYRHGDSRRELTPCISCHGPDAGGMLGYPALHGQDSRYLRQELAKFKSGVRRNDAGGLMSGIAAKLSETEIDALAELLSRMGVSG